MEEEVGKNLRREEEQEEQQDKENQGKEKEAIPRRAPKDTSLQKRGRATRRRDGKGGVGQRRKAPKHLPP